VRRLIAALLLLASFHALADVALTGRIELPQTTGRIDHMAVDVDHGRLFVAALAADAVEVLDLKSGQRIDRLEGRHEPQGLAFVTSTQRLVVANGRGEVEAFSGATRDAAVGGLPDADNVRLDAKADRLYVGFASGLAVLDGRTLRVLERFALPGHPEAFELSSQGAEIFVNVPGAQAVIVVDRQTGRTLARWDVGPASRNFPMALDEPNHRLLVATRQPPSLQVFDTAAGKRVAQLPLCADADDLFFDAARQNLYAVCGEGQIAVVHRGDADGYEVTAHIPTSPGARTGLFVPALRTLFVAAPSRGTRPAEVLVYRID
jgi:hypothetical protein